MKHLRRFNESIDMNQYLSDIFLELEDEGYKVIIKNNSNFHNTAKAIAYYTVIIHGKTFKLKDIFDLLLTSDDYMGENGWYLNSMRFRSVSNYDYNRRDSLLNNDRPGVQKTPLKEWFSLTYNDIIKLKEGDINKEVLDIDYIEIEFKTR